MNRGEDPAPDDTVIEVPLPHASAPGGPLRLFTNRPFLWLVFGESFAMLARWGFFLALVGDATYRFDATPAQVGLLIGSYSLPLIVVSPLYGAAADRWSAKWLLVVSSLTVMSVPIIAVTTSSLAGLYLAAILYGLGYAAEMPARGALVPRLVGQDRLVQANGMITAASSVQMVIGPALGALLTGVGGPTAPYFVSIVAGGLGAAFFLPVPD
ncbi:MAG: MFS transporter, partial [Actinomycetota bacterium]